MSEEVTNNILNKRWLLRTWRNWYYKIGMVYVQECSLKMETFRAAPVENGEGTKSGKSQIYLMASFTSAHYGNLCCKWPYSPQPPPPTHMPSPHPISSWIHQGLSLWADFQCTCVSWWHYFGLEYGSEVLRICLQATCCFWIIKELPNKSLNCIMILFWSRKHCSTSWFCVGIFVTDLGGNR